MRALCFVVAVLLACACSKVDNGSAATPGGGCISSTTYDSSLRSFDLGVKDTATDGGAGGLRIAQSFLVPGTTGSTMAVTSVSLPLYATATLPAGNVTLQIFTDSSNLPGTAVSGTTVITTQNTIPTALTVTRFAFSSAVNLNVGSTYWIVLDATYGQTNSPVLKWAADDVSSGNTSIYSNGHAVFESDSSPGPSGVWGVGSGSSGRELGFIIDCNS